MFSTGMTTLLDRFSRTFIGIEFKEDTLIITCLKNDLSGMDLLSSSTFPLRDDDETLTKINRFIAENVRSPNDVFVSIPHEWSVIKFTEVPLPKGKGKDALIHMMRFEIERHIPYQIEDVFFDFQVVEKSEAAHKVIFVAVHKEKIDYVKGFLEKISLKPRVITLSLFAILNSVELSEVLVGGWQNLLGITKKSNIWGRKDEICFSLFINNDNAHFAVLKGGSCVHLNSFVLNRTKTSDEIADDISSELTALPPELSHDKISKLILSGPTSLSELSGALGAKLEINVQTINPVSKFLNNRENSERLDITPSVGVCYSGLGMGTLGINLLPHKADFTLRKTGALITKISIPLILFMIIGIFTGEIVNDKRLLMKIEKKLKENEPEIKVIEKLSTDLSNLEQQRNFLLDTKENNIVLDILSELTNILPSGAWLTNFHYKEIYNVKEETLKGELIMSGFAVSSSALISILEDSPFFEKVEFVGQIRKRGDKEGFKIKAVTVTPARSPKVPSSQIKR